MKGAEVLNSYPWYISDWRQDEDVIAMTSEQRGIYRDLLDVCWDQGSLPTDTKLLTKLALCSPWEWKRSWQVVSRKFIEIDGRLHHPKVDEKRAELIQLQENRRRGAEETNKLTAAHAAKLKADAERIAERDAERTLRAGVPTPTVLLPYPDSEHPLPPQGDVLVLAAPEPKQRVRKAKAEAIPESPEFVEFYRLYPRHVGRGPAWKAWRDHVHNGDGPKVIAGLKAALPALNRAEEDKRPHPSTWLDQERWRDCEGLNGTAPRSSLPFHVATPRPANVEMLKFEIPKGEKGGGK